VANPDCLDYYEILQVSPNADLEVIKAAYKRLALKYHPDSGGAQASIEVMRLLNDAYAVLCDPELRQAYDLQQARRPLRGERTDSGSSGRRLLYHSDFYASANEWYQGSGADHKCFRRNGHYHIAVLRPNWSRWSNLQVSVTDFEIGVDVQFAANSGKGSTCGVEFRSNDFGKYRFSISGNGYYRLAAFLAPRDEWAVLLDWRFSEFLRWGDEINTLLIKAARSLIHLGTNGYPLTSVRNSMFSGGIVALFASCGYYDEFAEVRFRDFRLYSAKPDISSEA
jgi:curved DNA-binding protein CbpA